MTTNPNDPINPCTIKPNERIPAGWEGIPEPSVFMQGLSKRECFAAMAMQGLKSNQLTLGNSANYLAEMAVLQADALINELNKTP